MAAAWSGLLPPCRLVVFTSALTGTLTYGTNPSTNYLLRVKGDIHVYQFGALNIGSPGAEIPRSSTAVLQFQPNAADGDFGLNCRDYSVVNIAGLSRTAGKNIVKCKLTADVTSASLITTGQNAGGTTSAVGLDASGTSRNAASQVDSTANSTHGTYWYNGSTYINQTQTGMVWLAPGNGLNNRYARLTMGNNSPDRCDERVLCRCRFADGDVRDGCGDW